MEETFFNPDSPDYIDPEDLSAAVDLYDRVFTFQDHHERALEEEEYLAPEEDVFAVLREPKETKEAKGKKPEIKTAKPKAELRFSWPKIERRF